VEAETNGPTPLSNLLRIAALLVVAYMIVYAITPFSAPEQGPHYALRHFEPRTSQSSLENGSFIVAVPQVHCSAPIIDAWRTPTASTGWFGYAPLSTTTYVSGSGCAAISRHRLIMSLLGVIIAFVLVLIARRGDRRPGFGLDPAPT